MDDTYIQVSRLMLQAKAFAQAAHQYLESNPLEAEKHVVYAVGIMRVVDRVPSLNHEERLLRAQVTRLIDTATRAADGTLAGG